MKVVIGVETAPRLQFTIDADPYDMPDLIQLVDGPLLKLVGSYLSPGHNFSYRHVNRTMFFDGEVKPWVQYSGLKG